MWTKVKEYILITIGVLIYVTGWTIFMLPNNLVGGGVTGMASIIQYATGGAIKMGYSYFVLNIGLLVLAVCTLGKGFGFKTVYAIVLASVGLNVLQLVIPAEICQSLAVDNGKLMSTIMGGIAVGVGVGMTMSNGGSTGGTDIIALVVNKYRNISPGRMVLFVDSMVILSSLLVPSYTADGTLIPFLDKITTVVYGFILIVICSTVMDMYISGSRQSVQLFIFSKKYEEISDWIIKDFHRGVTVLNGKGWYSKEDTHVVMVLTKKRDLNTLLKFIKKIDPDAFLSISSVSEVYGQGFDKIKK